MPPIDQTMFSDVMRNLRQQSVICAHRHTFTQTNWSFIEFVVYSIICNARNYTRSAGAASLSCLKANTPAICVQMMHYICRAVVHECTCLTSSLRAGRCTSALLALVHQLNVC